MIVKLFKDHMKKDSDFCGQLREILTASDYPHLSIAIAVNIEDTKAHYHDDFEEIKCIRPDNSQGKDRYEPPGEQGRDANKTVYKNTGGSRERSYGNCPRRKLGNQGDPDAPVFGARHPRDHIDHALTGTHGVASSGHTNPEF